MEKIKGAAEGVIMDEGYGMEGAADDTGIEEGVDHAPARTQGTRTKRAARATNGDRICIVKI